ncbi:FAD-dependent oxidoreductase [Thermogymnomonas acidicola]|uniref:FAD-dependent oxidoreductase n=1 Tax=Thermogymnomonas acidicola TaxID=399579 RepID=UPI0009464C98|nr:FAD-dependent oxidoreductase [Thermogymnomonas acidicola]
MRAVVVGGGFGGLASAAVLARMGFQVTVVEKNFALGGRARASPKRASPSTWGGHPGTSCPRYLTGSSRP